MSEGDDIDRSTWPAEWIEEERLEKVTEPLFDMWLRFERAFARLAIDRLDVSDDDAEKMAVRMEASDTESGRAYAYLLRGIARARTMRVVLHRVDAIWAAAGTREPLSMQDIAERYGKLQAGKA
jgi:hypothetical protein